MAFWKKIFKSKYTGAEIDAAIAKAGDATKVTANPSLAGTEAVLTGLEVGTTKYKVEQPINVVANPILEGTEASLESLQVGDTKYQAGVPLVSAPQAFETSLNTAIQSLAAALMGDTKLHKATFSFDDDDAGFLDVFEFYGAITAKSVRVQCGNIGVVYAEATFDGTSSKTTLKNYMIVPGLGFGEIIILMSTISDGTTVSEIDCELYARRIEMAT